ncbi:MAG: ferritin family protein [Betaproteobacteria bacterium]|nr:ferritin family protein [Betaproteobacteria bacterium]
MDAIHLHGGHPKIDRGFAPPGSRRAATKARSSKPIGSLGELYAHAFAIEHEAAVRYREFAALMANCGNDTTAELFGRLAQFGVERAFHLAKKSVGIEIPIVDPGHCAWLDDGVLVPEARAFIFRMMTPRMALEIALRAEKRAKAYFERVFAESRNAGVRKLAAEFVRDEQSHIDWVTDALARLPMPFRADGDQPGDRTIEQQV